MQTLNTKQELAIIAEVFDSCHKAPGWDAHGDKWGLENASLAAKLRQMGISGIRCLQTDVY